MVDTRCGLLCWKPACLQKLNKPVCLMIVLSMCNCIQSLTVNGLMPVVLSTIEKRFHLSSSQSSWIASAYDLSTIPAVIVCSLIGARAHRAGWCSFGMVLLSLGSILIFLPHFTTPIYTPGSSDVSDSLCRNRNYSETCSEDRPTDLSNYLALFIIARVIHGFGATPIYTLGVTLMDDCVTRDKFSLYIGIFYGMGVIGPAVGVFIGGYMLNIYTNFYNVDQDSLGFDNNDPRWIGAWWLGFAIAAGLCLIIAIPTSFFARDLPGAEEVRRNKKSEAYKEDNTDDAAAMDFSTARELPRDLKILVTNPTYIFLTLYTCCDSLIIGGFTAFGPKYVENQYTLSAAAAGMIFGVVLLPSGAGGTVVGGLLIERLKMTCTKIMRTELVVCLLVFLSSGIFFITCAEVRFAGVTQPYINGSNEGNLISGCNELCHCEHLAYDGVCSHDNMRFFSPCHAGCLNMTSSGGDKFYYDCSCITPANISLPMASNAECTSEDCKLLPVFMSIFFFGVFFIFACSSFNISATVRSVPGAQRSLAIGLQWVGVRLLGTVPGPLVFGAAFDGSCLLWPERCGERGSCLYYENFSMALALFFVCAGVKVLSAIFIILAWRLYKPPQNNSETLVITENGNVGVDGADSVKNGNVATVYESVAPISFQNGAAESEGKLTLYSNIDVNLKGWKRLDE